MICMHAECKVRASYGCPLLRKRVFCKAHKRKFDVHISRLANKTSKSYFEDTIRAAENEILALSEQVTLFKDTSAVCATNVYLHQLTNDLTLKLEDLTNAYCGPNHDPMFHSVPSIASIRTASYDISRHGLHHGIHVLAPHVYEKSPLVSLARLQITSTSEYGITTFNLHRIPTVTPICPVVVDLFKDFLLPIYAEQLGSTSNIFGVRSPLLGAYVPLHGCSNDGQFEYPNQFIPPSSANLFEVEPCSSWSTDRKVLTSTAVTSLFNNAALFLRASGFSDFRIECVQIIYNTPRDFHDVSPSLKLQWPHTFYKRKYRNGSVIHDPSRLLCYATTDISSNVWLLADSVWRKFTVRKGDFLFW